MAAIGGTSNPQRRARRRGGARVVALGGSIGAIALVLCNVVAARAAASDDAAPPATRIITPFGSAAGEISSAYWTTRDGRFCVTAAGDGPLTFGPDGLLVRAGALVRIRLFKRARPTEVQLTAWHKVDPNGSPVGRGRPVRTHLSSHVVVGHPRAWDVVFRVPGYRSVYLSLFATWPDEEGCSTIQDAAWSFELARTT